jgi:ABC-2 type transport system permease protein
MKNIITLLMPRICSFKGKRFSKNNTGGLFKLLLFGTIGIVFWGGIFAVSLRVLCYFKEIAELGDILACKLLSMILLTFFFLLLI